MGDDNNIPGALTFGTPGHLNTVVDSFENGKPTTFDTSSFFTGNGNANGIGVIRNTDTYHSQNSFATYNDETKTYSYNIDKYTYGVLMPITNDEGIAMHNKAMEIRKNPGTYQVFTHNCNQVAQEILSAGGKDFASQGFALQYTMPNKVRDVLVTAIQGAKFPDEVKISNPSNIYANAIVFNNLNYVCGKIKNFQYIIDC